MSVASLAYQPLSREEGHQGRRAEGSGRASRSSWRSGRGEGLHEQYGDRLRYFDERYPTDVGMVWQGPLDVNSMGLSWKWGEGKAHDAPRGHQRLEAPGRVHREDAEPRFERIQTPSSPKLREQADEVRASGTLSHVLLVGVVLRAPMGSPRHGEPPRRLLRSAGERSSPP